MHVLFSLGKKINNESKTNVFEPVLVSWDHRPLAVAWVAQQSALAPAISLEIGDHLLFLSSHEIVVD